MNVRFPDAPSVGLERVLLLGVLAAAVWLVLAETRARRAEQAWRVLMAESEALRAGGVEAALTLNGRGERWWKQREAQADQWEDALGRDASLPRRSPPQGGAEVYFALAQRVEEWRRQLAAAGVETREGERFAFASHRFSGPPGELAAHVIHQQEKVGRLVDAVGHARARALVRIEREAHGGERAETLVAEDFFVPPSGGRLPLPSEWEQALFRVAFIGETATLRQFLEHFRDRSPDGFVRWVEVRPWSDATRGPAVAPGAPTVPLHFIVTVAFLDWPHSDRGDREGGS